MLLIHTLYQAILLWTSLGLVVGADVKKSQLPGLLTSKRPLEPSHLAVDKAGEWFDDSDSSGPVSIVTEQVTRFKFFSKTFLVLKRA